MDESGDEQVGLDITDVLGAVAEFGSASLGLVAWEYMVAEHIVEPLWTEAVDSRLLVVDGRDAHGEETCKLTPLGRAQLGDREAEDRRAG